MTRAISRRPVAVLLAVALAFGLSAEGCSGTYCPKGKPLYFNHNTQCRCQLSGQSRGQWRQMTPCSKQGGS